MLRLSLVRHAKSSWAEPAMRDFDRPLNARGLRNAPVMAQRLAALPKPPTLLLSSPALRALSTARCFAEALGIAPAAIAQEPRIYEADTRTLLDVIGSLGAAHRSVALFGHNPGFSDLAQLLAHCPFDQMPTCAVAVLELHLANWSEIGPGCGRVAEYLYPKDGGD